MSNPLSFSSFRKQQAWLARAPLFALFAVLAGVIVVAGFAYLFSLQTALVEGVRASTMSSSQVAAHSIHFALILKGVLFFAVATPIIGGLLEHKSSQRSLSRYNAYLASFDFASLKRFASGLETDESTRSVVVAQLSHRQPGWSYA